MIYNIYANNSILKKKNFELICVTLKLKASILLIFKNRFMKETRKNNSYNDFHNPNYLTQFSTNSEHYIKYHFELTFDRKIA